MNRVTQPAAECWSKTKSLLPPRILDMVSNVDLLSGVDACFTGLHRYSVTSDGRSYAATPHVAYPHHQKHLSRSRRRTTVVLPTRRSLTTECVVHELGHVLHERVGFAPVFTPLTQYGYTNHREAFAESFKLWIRSKRREDWAAWLRRYASSQVAFFESLEFGE